MFKSQRVQSLQSEEKIRKSGKYYCGIWGERYTIGSKMNQKEEGLRLAQATGASNKFELNKGVLWLGDGEGVLRTVMLNLHA